MTELNLADHEIGTNGQQMPNGERRFRMTAPDDSAYIRTEAGEQGAWQNAHSHGGVRETYIVQSGWMAFATIGGDGSPHVVIYRAGEVVSSEPAHVHNVYLPAGAVIHTVKHGEAVGNPDKGGADWWPASGAFDAATKSLTEVELLG